MKEILCECGNGEQDRFHAVTPVVSFEKRHCGPVTERRTVYQLKGWRCQDCQKVNL